MPDTRIGTHTDVEVFLRADGIFYATVDALLLTDKTLAGLKKRIDNYRRANTRTRAAAVQVAVLVLGSEWVDNDTRRPTATWHRGLFGGVNAHTGVITIVNAGGQKETIDDAAWFFRADSAEAIARVQVLIEERIRTEAVAALAKRRLQDELTTHARHVGGHYDSRGTEKAAKVEDELITALEARP
jgi:hypothetical protein